MARKSTPTIPFLELKEICKAKGITSWPEYQKRYTEIPGAKKTLHASYKGKFKGNLDFFGKPDTIEKKSPAKKTAVKKSKKAANKTASNASKKSKKPVAKKAKPRKKAAAKS